MNTHIGGWNGTYAHGQVLMHGDTAISIDSPWRKAHYHNTKLFNFLQWNLFTRCDTDSAWWLVMLQWFRKTIIYKLNGIIKDRNKTSIPGLKPVSLWFCRGRRIRNPRSLPLHMYPGSMLHLPLFKDGQSISLNTERVQRAESVASALSLLPSHFKNTEIW